MRDLSVVLEVAAILLPALGLVGVLAAGAWAAIRRDRSMAAVAGAWLAFTLVATFGPWLPQGQREPAQPLDVVVANVLVDNPTPEEVAADVIAQRPDIAVVPEAGGEVHRILAAAFPHSARRPGSRSAIGVYSHLPLRPLPAAILGPEREQRLEVETPAGEVVLWALHLPRPWLIPESNYQMRPGAQARFVDRYVRAFEAEELPVVVAGDLNLPDRGRGFRRIVDGRRSAMRSDWGGPTEVKALFRPLFLAIDHVLVPQDWCAEGARRFELTGSDHRGVGVAIGTC